MSGVVIGRVVFRPTGEVVGFEKGVWAGSAVRPTREQMKLWTVETDAQDGELCQTLAVVSFAVGDEDDTPKEPKTDLSGMVHVRVHAESLPIDVTISDPAPYSITRKWLWFRFTRRVR